jgi:ribosomal protein S27E
MEVWMMGAWYAHRCEKCDYEVNTQGPWEFYRDKNGTRKPYGKIAPVSKEAAECGISGLMGEVYCPDCDEVFEVILVEFKTPTIKSPNAEIIDECKKKDAVKCPKCGNLELIFEDDHENINCPRCENGILIGRMTRVY